MSQIHVMQNNSEMKAVDLGLSVYWGENPLEVPNKHYEECLFSWGDDSYNNSHNKNHEEDDFDELTNNGIITDEGFLTPQYDHAYQILGEKWRIPAVEELKELIDKCEWTWIGDGYAVTGPSKNSIKIPYVVSYRDTGRSIIEDIWYSDVEIERKIVSKEVGSFWSSEPSFEDYGDSLLYTAYALSISDPEQKSRIEISTEMRNKKNLIIPVTLDSSLIKEESFVSIKPRRRRSSFIAPDAFIDDYTNNPFSDIVPPPIVYKMTNEMTEEEFIKKYGVTKEEYLNENYNEVSNLTAKCQRNISKLWVYEEYPELEVGKTYEVSLIGVYRSSSRIILRGFGDKQYNASCFELFENGEPLGMKYVQDLRFWAPYLREKYKKIHQHQ